MFKWWNEPIMPRSSVKWNYPLIVAVLWVTARYSINGTLVAVDTALEVLAILFASIALATLQVMFSKPKETSPATSEQAKAIEQRTKKRKRKAKRHP